MKRPKIAPELKEQILNRIKNDGVTVMEAAKDHGISENTIYSWFSRKVKGQPTLSEIVKLKRENAQLLQLVEKMTLKLSDKLSLELLLLFININYTLETKQKTPPDLALVYDN